MTEPVFDVALERRFTDSAEIATINVTSADTLLIRDSATGAIMRLPFSTLASAISSAFSSSFASLVDGKVPASQLPSYVDDVLEYANLGAFPATGETGKIYVALDTNKTYRWSGSAYIYITSGAVDSVAGKTGVVTLVKADVGLSNVDNTTDANKPISTATQSALNGKEASITAGTTAQYWRGDKSWRDFATDVRAVVLTGLSTATNAAIAATDSVLSALGKLQKQVSDNLTTLTTHTGNTSNPHSVTKTQVGLANVDNTSDASKPVSTAQQTAIDTKLNVANVIPTGSAIQSDENEVIRTGFHLGGSANLDISTKAFSSSNKWRLIVIGAFANNYDGGGLTNLPCFIEVTETSNTIAVGGTTILTFTRNATTGKINVANSSASYAVQFTGTIFVTSFKQGATPTESMRLVNALSVGGKFACNGATPQAKATLNAASTDLSSVVALCNQIRTALINNGVAQ